MEPRNGFGKLRKSSPLFAMAVVIISSSTAKWCCGNCLRHHESSELFPRQRSNSDDQIDGLRIVDVEPHRARRDRNRCRADERRASFSSRQVRPCRRHRHGDSQLAWLPADVRLARLRLQSPRGPSLVPAYQARCPSIRGQQTRSSLGQGRLAPVSGSKALHPLARSLRAL